MNKKRIFLYLILLLMIGVVIVGILDFNITFDTDQEKDEGIAIEDCGIVLDERDGNRYETVDLGDQCWFVDNLQFDPGCSKRDWIEGEDVGWCGYHEEDEDLEYGLLYQWSTTENDLCPQGWRVPTDEEFLEMEREVCEVFFGEDCDNDFSSKGYRGNAEGEILTSNDYCNGNDCQSIGFEAKMGGYRHSNGTFSYFGSDTFFWTKTEDNGQALGRNINTTMKKIRRENYPKSRAYSIRCIKS